MAFKINLGSLTVSIGADTDGFEDGQEKVKKGLKKTDSELRKSANDFAKWGAAAAGAAAIAVAAFAKTQLSAIKELKNLASAANTTVKEFQRGAFAAASVGIETEKYGDILKDVNDRIGDFVATGGGPMIDFFEQIGPKIGVTIDDFKKLSGQEALGLYVKSLEKANLSQQDMTFFMEAMATNSTLLIPLLNDNAEAFNKLTEEAKALGIGLDELDVIKASIANEEIAKSGAAIDSISQKITLGLTPAIAGITQAFNDSAATAGGWEKVAREAVNNFVKVIGFAWDAIHGLEVVFKGVEVAVSVAMHKASEVMDTFRQSPLKLVGQGIYNNLILPMEVFEKALSLMSKTSSSFASSFSQFKGMKEELFAPAPESDFTKAAREGVEKLKTDLALLALETMPSKTLDAAVKTAFDAFDAEVAKRAAGKKEANKNKESKDEETGLVPVVEEYQAQSISLFEAMGVRFQTTEEMQIQQYQREFDLLKQGKEKGFILEKEFKEKSLDLEKKTENAKRALMVSNMQGALQHLAGNSKKVQKVMKAAAIANAAVSGYEAAVDAWKFGMKTGPWTAAAYTAASLVKTGALISKIKSGGKSQSSSGGGGFSASTPRQPQTQQNQSQGQNGPAQAIQINLTGGAAQLFSVEQIRSLADQLNDAIGDGVQLGLIGA